MNMKSNNPVNRLAATIAMVLVSGLLAAPVFASAQDHKGTHAPAKVEQAGDSEQPVTDTWITTKVKADLLTTSDIPAADISVDTVNGVVALSGTVQSREQVDKAVAVTKQIKGVKKVDSSKLQVSIAGK